VADIKSHYIRETIQSKLRAINGKFGNYITNHHKKLKIDGMNFFCLYETY